MNEIQRAEFAQTYENSSHRIGRIGLGISVILMLAAPFLMGGLLGAGPDWKAFWPVFAQVFILYWPSGVIECLVYSPMLGSGASYLAFVTGNVTNLKLPCAMNSRQICETEVGTPENDIVSTLSVATSAIVTTLALVIGVLCLVPLRPVLENPALSPAFQNVIPALFGALAFKHFYKNMKIAALPLLLMCVIFVMVPSLIGSVSFFMILSGALAIILAYVLFKAGKL